MTLAVFNVHRAKDPLGKDLDPNIEFATGIIRFEFSFTQVNQNVLCPSSRPKDFVCSISPRSAKAAALIRSVEVEHPFEKSNAEDLVDLTWPEPHNYYENL